MTDRSALDAAPLPLVKLGHPILRQSATPVDPLRDPALARLAQRMIATMAAHQGVGLAAPQVGERLRLIVFETPAPRASEAPHDETFVEGVQVLANPVLTPLAEPGLALGMEGCLSIPGLRGIVPRHRAVRWQGLDLAGQPVEGIARGFHARVLQHEVDHLDGIVYLDRMTDLRALGFEEHADRLPDLVSAPRAP